MFKTARKEIQFRASWNQSTFWYSLPLISVLILFCPVRPGLLWCFFTWWSQANDRSLTDSRLQRTSVYSRPVAYLFSSYSYRLLQVAFTSGERFGLVDTPEGTGGEYNSRQEGLSIELSSPTSVGRLSVVSVCIMTFADGVLTQSTVKMEGHPVLAVTSVVYLVYSTAVLHNARPFLPPETWIHVVT